MFRSLKKPLLIRQKAVLSSNFNDSIDEKWLYKQKKNKKNNELKIFAIKYFEIFPHKIPRYD